MEVTEVISRANAKELGLRRYFTGEPCRHGHLSERYVACGRCVECDRIASKKATLRRSRQAAPAAPAQPPTQPLAAPSQGGKGSTHKARAANGAGREALGFREPKEWKFDGGKRREPVLDLDHNPPRVVRMVGWRMCMRCSTPFWSGDVVRVRMCGECKAPPRGQRRNP